MSLWDRLRQGLARSRSGWVTQLKKAVAGGRGRIDEELLLELEESLLEADVGLDGRRPSWTLCGRRRPKSAPARPTRSCPSSAA